MDKITVNGVELQINATPKLIFMANNIRNRGRSHKSYSFEISNNAHNNEALHGALKQKRNWLNNIAAVYEIDGFQLIGHINIITINDRTARATFISGNGGLWTKLNDLNLKHDFDYSEFDTVLNGVNRKEAWLGLLPIMPMFADRGAVDYLNKPADYEFYPDVKIISVIEKMFTSVGVGWIPPLVSDEFQRAYYLMMQDTAIRNSEEWLESAYGLAGPMQTAVDTKNLTSSPANVAYSFNRTFTQIQQGEDNFISSQYYVVPEDGTYNVRISSLVSGDLGIDTTKIESVSGQGDDSVLLLIDLMLNKTELFHHRSVLQEIMDGTPENLDEKLIPSTGLSLTTSDMQLSEGDELSVRVRVQYRAEFSTATQHTVTVSDGEFEIMPSRWYGFGSTVRMQDILPDTNALRWLSRILNFFNVDVFYNQITNQVQLIQGVIEREPIAEIYAFDYQEKLQQPSTYVLEFNNDKFETPGNIPLTATVSTETQTINVPYSRSLITTVDRFESTGFSDRRVVRLWTESGVPEWESKGNERIMIAERGTRKIDGSPFMIRSAESTDEDDIESADLKEYQEPDYVRLNRDLLREQRTCSFEAAISNTLVYKLYTNDLMKAPVSVFDRDTGDLLAVARITEARQSGGSVYKFTGEIL